MGGEDDAILAFAQNMRSSTDNRRSSVATSDDGSDDGMAPLFVDDNGGSSPSRPSPQRPRFRNPAAAMAYATAAAAAATGDTPIWLWVKRFIVVALFMFAMCCTIFRGAFICNHGNNKNAAMPPDGEFWRQPPVQPQPVPQQPVQPPADKLEPSKPKEEPEQEEKQSEHEQQQSKQPEEPQQPEQQEPERPEQQEPAQSAQSEQQSPSPTAKPTAAPTSKPTLPPSESPKQQSSFSWFHKRTPVPTSKPSLRPSAKPTDKPTMAPTVSPTSASPTSEMQHFQNYLSSNLQSGRTALLEQFKAQYGPEYFEEIFWNSATNTSRGRTAFQSPRASSKSWSRLKRVVMTKLLEGADSSIPVPLVWATGGNGRAAGHGNLYNQSYTAVLEDAMKPVFKRLGIDFVARNYASSAASEAPETSWCSQAIYGTDVDILNWDFGAPSIRHPSEYQTTPMQLYFYRAAAVKTAKRRPATIVMLHQADETRVEAYAALEAVGMTSLYLNHSAVLEMMDHLPTSKSSIAETLPPNLQHFKCSGGQLESGTTSCSGNKFDQSVCKERGFQAFENPGWKWHAFHGTLLSLLLLEVLEDAVRDIAATSSRSRPEHLMEEMEQGQLQYASKLENAAVPSTAASEVSLDPPLHGSVTIPSDMLATFFTKPCVCHTALLPAQSRYRGIVKEATSSLRQTPLDAIQTELEFDLDKTNSDTNVVESQPNADDSMRLISDTSTRQAKTCHEDAAIIPFNLDHADYWYLHHDEEGKQLTLPNDAAIEAYDYDHKAVQGIIAVCYPQSCYDDSNCIVNGLGGEGDDKQLTIEVNGIAAVAMSAVRFHRQEDENDDDFETPSVSARSGSATKPGITSNCFLLQHEDSHVFMPDSHGRFRIRLRVGEEGKHARFTSWVLW